MKLFNPPTVETIEKDLISLSELKSIPLVKSPYSDEDKVRIQRLESLGFTSNPDVVAYQKHKTAVAERHEKRQRIENIKSVLSLYPIYKYISEDALQSVCKKYKLYKGYPKRFIGKIPVEKQREILNFKADPKLFSGKILIVAPLNMFNLGKIDSHKGVVTKETHLIQEEYTLNYKMRMAFNNMKESMKSFLMFNTDPIVLQPLQIGGYFIVTSWGPEASDELVANERMN